MSLIAKPNRFYHVFSWRLTAINRRDLVYNLFVFSFLLQSSLRSALTINLTVSVIDRSLTDRPTQCSKMCKGDGSKSHHAAYKNKIKMSNWSSQLNTNVMLNAAARLVFSLRINMIVWRNSFSSCIGWKWSSESSTNSLYSSSDVFTVWRHST